MRAKQISGNNYKRSKVFGRGKFFLSLLPLPSRRGNGGWQKESFSKQAQVSLGPCLNSPELLDVDSRKKNPLIKLLIN